MARPNFKKTVVFQKSWANTGGRCPVSRPYIPTSSPSYWTDEQNDTARRGFWDEVAAELSEGFVFGLQVN